MPTTFETSNKVFNIALVFADLTTKTATVSKLTKVIHYKGKFFLQQPQLGLVYYHQVEGEDLSNIEVCG